MAGRRGRPCARAPGPRRDPDRQGRRRHPVPGDGRGVRLCAAEGEILDVGAVLAVFEVDGAGTPRARARSLPLAAPTTRRLARELGVSLQDVAGSGPHGRILREDVERAVRPAPSAPPPRRRNSAGGRARRGRARCAAFGAPSPTRSRAPGWRSRASSTTARSTPPRSLRARASLRRRALSAARRPSPGADADAADRARRGAGRARAPLRQRLDRPRARGDHAAPPLPRRHRDCRPGRADRAGRPRRRPPLAGRDRSSRSPSWRAPRASVA